MKTLWPHQIQAVEEIEKAWNSGILSVCYQLPTGGGKSKIFSHITKTHHAANRYIYIIAHRKNLVKQLSKELVTVNVEHGIISASSPNLKYRVQVCSLQTLVRRMAILPSPDVLIIDEAHHIKSNSYLKIIEACPPDTKILGLTATPRRLDGKPLGDIFKQLIKGPPPGQLIEDGFLSKYDYYAPDDIDMTGEKIFLGDFQKSVLNKKVNRREITGNMIQHYQKYADHKPGIVACCSIEHTEDVAQQFREAGYRAECIHSKMKQHEIDARLKSLESGEIELLCQADLIGEGIDIPGVVVYLWLRPTASTVVFLQGCGRALRVAPGKEKAIIIDPVNNWKFHGLPDDDREWSLNGKSRTKETEENKYKRCPSCMTPISRFLMICPHCEYKFVSQGRPLPTVKPGELIKIERDRQELIRKIAREARTKYEALVMAGQAGVQIWEKILHKT